MSKKGRRDVSTDMSTTVPDVPETPGATASAISTPAVIAAMLRSGNGISDLVFSPLRPPQVEILEFSVAAAERYGRIRADRSIAPADAVQLACASAARVDLFLTNDRRLSRKVIPGIHFIASIQTDLI